MQRQPDKSESPALSPLSLAELLRPPLKAERGYEGIAKHLLEAEEACSLLVGGKNLYNRKRLVLSRGRQPGRAPPLLSPSLLRISSLLHFNTLRLDRARASLLVRPEEEASEEESCGRKGKGQRRTRLVFNFGVRGSDLGEAKVVENK